MPFCVFIIIVTAVIVITRKSTTCLKTMIYATFLDHLEFNLWIGKKKWFMEGIPNLQNVYSWMLNVNFIYVEIHLKIISLFNHLWASSLPWAELDPWLLCLRYSHSLPLKNSSSSYIFPFPHFKANKILWPSWLRNGLCFWAKSQFPARCTPSGFLKSLNLLSKYARYIGGQHHHREDRTVENL